MAKLSPPSRAKNEEKATLKAENNTGMAKVVSSNPTDQVPPDAIKPLQLKIPESRKNEFKAYAAMNGRSMNALFLEMFSEYKQKHANN